MDALVLGVLSAIGLIVFLLVIGACCSTPTYSREYNALSTLGLRYDCPHDEAYWRGRGERCHLCGWGLCKIPDCKHVWERVAEQKDICRYCGTTQLTFYLGTIQPGESKFIDIGMED